MAVPLARSSDEVHLYLELHPCPCGESDFGATSAVSFRDDQWWVRYDGACVECGRSRAFEFRQPDQPSVPAEDRWADGDHPSELLDAGEWLWVADTYGGVPVAEPELTDGERIQRRTDLLAAGAAVDEVLKFLPAGAAEVPSGAFWTPRGRALRAADPGRFRRERLAAVRDTYRTALA